MLNYDGFYKKHVNEQVTRNDIHLFWGLSAIDDDEIHLNIQILILSLLNIQHKALYLPKIPNLFLKPSIIIITKSCGINRCSSALKTGTQFKYKYHFS